MYIYIISISIFLFCIFIINFIKNKKQIIENFEEENNISDVNEIIVEISKNPNTSNKGNNFLSLLTRQLQGLANLEDQLLQKLKKL
jgi:uncharacterized protein YoxC